MLKIELSANTPLDEVPDLWSISLTLAKPICPLAFSVPAPATTAS